MNIKQNYQNFELIYFLRISWCQIFWPGTLSASSYLSGILAICQSRCPSQQYHTGAPQYPNRFCRGVVTDDSKDLALFIVAGYETILRYRNVVCQFQLVWYSLWPTKALFWWRKGALHSRESRRTGWCRGGVYLVDVSSAVQNFQHHMSRRFWYTDGMSLGFGWTFIGGCSRINQCQGCVSVVNWISMCLVSYFYITVLFYFFIV